MTPTNQTKATHSQLPWTCEERCIHSAVSTDLPIMRLSGDGITIEEDRANAALIVQAVNSYEAFKELVEDVDSLLIRMDVEDNHAESRLQFATRSDYVSDVRRSLIKAMQLSKENPKA